MLALDPKCVCIHSENDAIDYVASGMVPSKEQYNELRSAILNPSTPEEYDKKLGNQAVVRDGAIEIPPEKFVAMLDRVYEQNVLRRNVSIATNCITGAVCLLFAGRMYKRGYKKGKEDAINV